MKSIKPSLFAAIGVFGMLSASAAHAHVHLLASTPAPDATTGETRNIVLTFKTAVSPQFTSVNVIMTAMPGMSGMGDMKMSGIATKISDDGKVVTAHSDRPLSAGSYRVAWHAVGADMHPGDGSFAFTVK